MGNYDQVFLEISNKIEEAEAALKAADWEHLGAVRDLEDAECVERRAREKLEEARYLLKYWREKQAHAAEIAGIKRN